MNWLQLVIAVEKQQAAVMEELLLASGALSVTLQDNADNPILEPGVGETPLWQKIKLTAMFESENRAGDLLDQLFSAYCESGLNQPSHQQHTVDKAEFSSRISFSTLEDREWEREWLKRFEPIQCGERLWICPSWCKPEDSKAINLMLDPGLAFGTGTHETTGLCLQWLDAQELTGRRVLDFGCGSGILGIAAILLGASHATFVDNDPQAVQATRDNLSKNGIDSSRYSIFLDREFDFASNESTYDVTLANILAEPLIKLSTALTGLLVTDGQLVLSGIQPAQEDFVRNAYDSKIEFFHTVEQNGWLRLDGKRLAS